MSIIVWVLIVIFVLWLLGGAWNTGPWYGVYGPNRAYYTPGIVGLILIIVVVLFLSGHL